MEKVIFDGYEFSAGSWDMFGVKILLIKAAGGALGCGYINLAAAEKFGHPLAIVSGVSSYEDMLNAKVNAVSTAAAEKGAAVGMSGSEVLKIFSR